MLFFTSLLEFKATHWHQELKNHTRPVRMVFWKISVKNEVKRKKRWTMISLFYKGRRRENKRVEQKRKIWKHFVLFCSKKNMYCSRKKNHPSFKLNSLLAFSVTAVLYYEQHSIYVRQWQWQKQSIALILGRFFLSSSSSLKYIALSFWNAHFHRPCHNIRQKRKYRKIDSWEQLGKKLSSI